MIRVMRRFARDDSGQATIEWTILAVAMGLIAIGIVTMVAPAIKNVITRMLAQLGSM